MTNMINGFAIVMNLPVVLTLAGSTLIGIIVGALPGLTATMGVSLLVGLTYGFHTEIALAARSEEHTSELQSQ